MTNSLLTIDMITNEALRILHQKSNFIGNINRQYDSSFAKNGAKIGDDMRIRLPNKYVVGDGATITPQATEEASVTLKVQTQKHVAVEFGAAEQTLSLDNYSERVLAPAMATLAAQIEADALSMFKDVHSQQANIGNAITYRDIMSARQILNNNLAPSDGKRCVIMNTQDNVDLNDGLKGLFNDSAQISKQYREGIIGRTGGFDFYENTHLGNFATGSDASGYLVNGASQAGNMLVVDTGTAMRYMDYVKPKSTGLLRAYAIADRLVFDTLADQNTTLNMRYYKAWDIATDGSNWLLTHSPDAYLYTALSAAAVKMQHPMHGSWEAEAQRVIAEIEQQTAKIKGNAPLRVEVGLLST